MSENSKERDILQVMRKVLSAIIRDTTPPPGHRHPLSDGTIQDVRMCLGLIAAREQELARENGEPAARPYFTDDPARPKVVSIDSIGRPEKKG